MPTMTISWPEEINGQPLQVYDAICDTYGYQDRVDSDDENAPGYDAETKTVPNPQSREAYAKQHMVQHAMTVYRGWALKKRMEAEQAKAQAEQDALRKAVEPQITVT